MCVRCVYNANPKDLSQPRFERVKLHCRATHEYKLLIPNVASSNDVSVTLNDVGVGLFLRPPPMP